MEIKQNLIQKKKNCLLRVFVEKEVYEILQFLIGFRPWE